MLQCGNTKSNLGQKEQTEDITMPNFKLYYKTKVIRGKTVQVLEEKSQKCSSME